MPWLFVILLLSVIGFLSAYLLLYKREVKAISKQLNFVRNHDTNKKVTLQLTTKEINELAIQLNHILDYYKLEKVAITRAQQEFKEEITNISHDLRTPLTSIAGYVQMLQLEDTSIEKKVEYYTIIKRRIETLVQLLDEFFEYTRLESEEYPLQFEIINVNHVLMDVLSLFYYDFLAKGEEPNIQIPSSPSYINVDIEALKRILQNLVKNYLNHGVGSLSISVNVENNRVSIQFKNHAPHIRPEEVQKLFNRFYTAEESRTKQSSGLGLSIVKSLVTKMNGEIDAIVKESFLIITVTFRTKTHG